MFQHQDWAAPNLGSVGFICKYALHKSHCFFTQDISDLRHRLHQRLVYNQPLPDPFSLLPENALRVRS